ncbi:MAG: type VI secretion system tip protein TssI/VgrG [Pseudomonadota bacterium]
MSPESSGGEDRTLLENRIAKLEWRHDSTPDKRLMVKSAIITEEISELTEISVEFFCRNKSIGLEEMVGEAFTLWLKTSEEETIGSEEEVTFTDEDRKFIGKATLAEFLGLSEGYAHFRIIIRPWFWFLTRTNDCRIYQEMKTQQIVEDIFSENGFSDYEFKLSESYEERVYCVQFRESDYAFISRLLEEEGICFFFDYSGTVEKLILTDNEGGFSAIKGESELAFSYREEDYRRRDDHIFEWTSGERVTRGVMSLDDYDFENSTADLFVTQSIEKGEHGHKSYEIYDTPGRYRQDSLGETRARVRMEAEAIRHRVSQGAGNARTVAAGYTFSLKEHEREQNNIEYLITKAVHKLQVETDYEDADTNTDDSRIGTRHEFDEDNKDTYRCEFGVVPKAEPYRPPLKTPWPEIPGLQTAEVVGPDGEEIYTDEYGRIKVQFHWDRLGEKDDASSCWVRTVMPWTGKNWGSIFIPRIGMEVVIQFEDGDPDRPICTGMLYNNTNMPPYDLPDNKTQSGIKTDSSKGSDGFNELMFEDLKGEELVRFQAEKDYEGIIKNNSTVTIGVEKEDAGDLTETIQNNVTRNIVKGDHTFTIETGSEVKSIKTDKTETIETGDHATTVRMGDLTVDVSLGKIHMTAMQEILLTVGASSIKIDQMGVTIKGMMITSQATIMSETKAPITQVKGDAVLIAKGGITLIN